MRRNAGGNAGVRAAHVVQRFNSVIQRSFSLHHALGERARENQAGPSRASKNERLSEPA